MRTAATVTFLVACSIVAASPQLFSQSRAQAIAAAFTKHKSVAREKYGVTVERYKDVRSEPVVKQNIGDYAGRYEVPDLGYVIDIQARNDGGIQATGYETGVQTRTFELENARIEGALLTATKLYRDGATERFEGVFLNRTERSSPTDMGVTTFGLGVVPAAPVERGGMMYDKLFYQLKQ